jgi:hypothetical protein
MVFLVLLSLYYTGPFILRNLKYDVVCHSERCMPDKWYFVLFKNIAVMLHGMPVRTPQFLYFEPL